MQTTDLRKINSSEMMSTRSSFSSIKVAAHVRTYSVENVATNLHKSNTNTGNS